MKKILKRFIFIADCDDWLYRQIIYDNLPTPPRGFYWGIAKDAPRPWSILRRKHPKACYVHMELREF